MAKLATQASDNQIRQRLLQGLDILGLELSELQVSCLLDYLRLFAKWNSAYNLSAVRRIDDMVPRHLLDSLSLVPYLEDGRRWIDVGSGGGLPGIPLAIVFPDKQLTLLDSNGKKTRFLFQIKTELQLENLEVVQSRVEDFRPVQPFDAVFSRAFASLPEFLTGCAHLVTPTGRFYAMKGQYPEDELREVEKPFNVEHCSSLRVPGETAARHLVVISRRCDRKPKQD